MTAASGMVPFDILMTKYRAMERKQRSRTYYVATISSHMVQKAARNMESKAIHIAEDRSKDGGDGDSNSSRCMY